jgi:hypothetical protein
MIDTLNADELRAWAQECAKRANNEAFPGEERARYLKMQESFLALAVNADWLAGRHVHMVAATAVQPTAN